MNELKYPGYFKTAENVTIFYNTNFPIESLKPDDVVIVFNYGLVCSVAHFSKQIPYFHEKGYKLLVHNYRGHYNSSGHQDIENLTFNTLCNDLNQLLVNFKIQHPFIIGHSMGVNVTLEYAKLFPEQILGMVLISGSVYPPHDVMFDSNLMEHIIPWLEKLSYSFPKLWRSFWRHSGLNPLVQYSIRRGGFNEQQVPYEFVQEYLIKMGQLPSNFFFHFIELMKRHDIINHLEKIKIPTLIIGGDQDRVIPNYLQKLLHDKLPDSELYLVKDGSHVPNMDFPDFINQRVQFFIDQTLRDYTLKSSFQDETLDNPTAV